MKSHEIRFNLYSRAAFGAENIANATKPIKQMQPAGLKAFAARKENRSGIYSYEQRSAELVEPYQAKLKRNKAAWKFFQSQPAWYRKVANWWVVSAKRDETRLKRLDQLIEDSAQGRTIRQVLRKK